MGMAVPDRIRRIDEALRSTRDLADAGVSARTLAALVGSGELIRVARGWFVSAEHWRSWYPADRHLAAVLAVHRSAKEPPLFSHFSAAVILGLPLWGLRDEPVHTVTATSPGRRNGIVRHRIALPKGTAGLFAGLRCTSPDRTLLDLAGIADAPLLVGAADAALRLAVDATRRPDPARVDAWRNGMRSQAAAAASTRGVRLLRHAIGFADARADSPLESVSRMHLDRLGFEIELQVRVPQRDHGHYYIDFEFVGLGIFGEADGDQKYLDATMLAGRSTAQAVLREKKRDNWVSGVTGHRMIHWGAAACRTTETFAAMLRDYNVPLPSGPRRF